ncbi:MAG: hypothetical protein M3N54_11085 [Acidobacteriota bacterium]|nr:hypothetical protein [Acidobacteriota bacterium]
MSVFLDNARKIFEVARADAQAEDADFALLVRPDGGLHVVMDSAGSPLPVSLEAAANHAGAVIAYRVTRSSRGVRVTGRSFDQDLVLEDRASRKAGAFQLLRDQPLYRITSPVLASASCG